MAMASEKDSVPVRIPGYVIEREIGRGGVATVFLAIQQSLDRKVALKVMSPALAAEPDFSVRFEREGRVVAGFSHPNIVTIYDVGVSNFQHYIAMEFLGAGSLKRQLVEPMDPHRALKIIKEISAALGYAHSHGYVHRDVKPENILFKNDGVAVLTDFGIAKSSNSNTQLTRSGTIVGTPRYMSPEQAHGNPATPQSDIYALGVILFEMLSGHPPFNTAESVAVLYAHINEPIPELPPESKALQPLVDAMMAKNFDDRVPDCETLADLAVMLERELDNPTGSHRRVWRPVRSVEQQRRDNAAGSDGASADTGYSGKTAASGEFTGVGAPAAAPTPLGINETRPPRRRRRGLYLGIGAVAAVFVAAVVFRSGVVNQWLNPPPDLPRAVAILSDDDAVPDEIVDLGESDAADSDAATTATASVAPAEPAATDQLPESVDDVSVTESVAETTTADLAPESDPDTNADAATAPEPNPDINANAGTATEPNPDINANAGTVTDSDPDIDAVADVNPEEAVDLDTTVPVATGTAVDPATVSGTMLAPPAPGTNSTPNAASDIPTVAIAPDQATVETAEQNVVLDDAAEAGASDPPQSDPNDAQAETDVEQADVAADQVTVESQPADTGAIIIVDNASVSIDAVSEDAGEQQTAVAATEEVDSRAGSDVSVVADSQSILPPETDQVDSEAAMTPVGLSVGDIPRLLIDANILVGDDKLAHPPNDNAVEIYQTVLAIASDNLEAKEGLDDIAGSYLEAAEEKIRKPDLARAALEIERGLKARPDHSRLIELQGEVRDMIEANAAYEEAENSFFGLDGPIDLVRSCDRYLEAAEKGHTQAALGLGICFANGFGFEQDEQQAIRWMNFAAEAKEPAAMYNLALGLLFGDSPDPDRAADYIREAAELGYDRAYRVLGWMHQTGTGVEESTRDAIKWGLRAIKERNETDSSTRKVVERWESVFEDAYNETQQSDDEQQDDSSS